jgi:hypothetical protein
MKTTLKLSFVALIANGLMMTACGSSETEESTNVEQERIYQDYSVIYDEEKGEMTYSATFLFGGPTGTTLELVDDSRVSVNGAKMHKISSNHTGTFYQIKEKADFSNKVNTFIYKDNDGKEFKNKIAPNLVQIPADIDPRISKSKGKTITWQGEALKSEIMYLDVRSKVDSFYAYESESTDKSTFIELTPEALKDVPLGDAGVQLRRSSKYVKINEAADVGGSISFSYYSKTVDMLIEK